MLRFRFCCVVAASAALVAVSLSAETQEDAVSSFDQRGQITVDGRATAYRIRNLPVSSFPELPPAIAATLTQRGCVIPQTYEAKRPENVIHASLLKPGSTDWAVLCSAQGKVDLLVFLANASVATPATLASVSPLKRLQAHDPTGEMGFDWGIDPASPRQVHDAQAVMAHRPPLLDHDCIAEIEIDRRTIYHLYRDGAWETVPTE